MSLESAIARVDEIRTMLAPKSSASTAAPAATADTAAPAFLDVLNTALDSSASDVSDDTSTESDEPGGGQYDAEIQAAAAREGVDPALVNAIIFRESGFNPNAGSAAGAQGLMALMPATAQELGVTNRLDPAQSIAGGTHLIREFIDRYHGDLSLALAAYNAGPGAVAKYGGIPPYGETQAYVRNVLADYRSNTERTTA